jgi:3-deoxy-7-phosphoheptulonate synthase
MVPSLAAAAVAAGADGLLIEVHVDPSSALSDGRQSLKPETFSSLMHQVAGISAVVGRRVAGLSPQREACAV